MHLRPKSACKLSKPKPSARVLSTATTTQPQTMRQRSSRQLFAKANTYWFALLGLLFMAACKKSETATPTVTSTAFSLTSTAVVNDLLLDAYKCEPKVNGIEKSLPLAWDNVPAGTNAFAMTMVHYPDPTNLTNYNSYLELWGIDKSVTGIAYGKAGDGPWFMGPNKDLRSISYSSPCSAGPGTHQYTITLYALSATPASLPTQSSMNVTYPVLTSAIATVTVVGKATLVFNSITP